MRTMMTMMFTSEHIIKRVFFKASRFNLFFVKEREDYDEREIGGKKTNRIDTHR